MPLGPVMLDLEGTTLTAAEQRLLCHPMAGGVILFTRNFQSVEQLTELVTRIHALRDPHLLVAVDHEGGRVQRFREGFTKLPPMARLGEVYDRNPTEARRRSRLLGWLMAAELRAAGVDFSFAPVLDLAHGCSGVIGDRAFHRSPHVVADLAVQWMRGMRSAGMEAVGKHFPGHGGVRADSHLELPVDERPQRDILTDDMLPFERLIEQGIAGLMPAHVVYSRADGLPAGFSRYWLRDILRGQLRFQGAIFSDDLSMAATETFGDYGERALKAQAAGCDMMLVCNHPDGAAQALDALAGHEAPVAMARLARMHGRRAPTWEALRKDPDWEAAVALAGSMDDSSNMELPV
ncbi:beta-N-acetylhexosaminidase [Ectothiorhodospira haloalkaliphila]|uniref:beta-N-acetylhexosaminidase n=1 Tax=Ectothiorhodospira haloalkaliphila TaxID=421628 RepID=UPI00047BC115|nr:beta-N-acetylhexosaminidase [Ectothiorhodospira haloalkaliphila]